MTDEPWLTPEEQRAWRSFVAMRQQLDRHLQRHMQQECGLSGPDFEILVNLSEAPGERMRAVDLVAATRWEKSRLSHHLRRMASRGLVRREDGAHRYPDVVLTAAGRDAIRTCAPANAARVRELFIEVLGPERLAVLAEASRDVLAALAEHRETACPPGIRDG
ncbi:MarR family winged helix-turn-helix transcriptional regulator [Mycolicibacillus trivialis]|uniref:MarR family transcriptional regulator n=1 Tax=Mycolicibacillus trivialis TaxID=1798 RepID=A0A1X2EH87_9MYCO|nr:MarR family winged helix-turn-helix transcriptional regulator [Mycolicibacillus trivialis]ORX02145.1 MarR family transcriptional regulator [Mycolicibacillus trivialis]